MSSKKLIINADDFGYSNHTAELTIQCFDAGILSSATLMPNMPAFGKAVTFAMEHPEFSYGLHLCLTDERPISNPRDIPSLVDAHGKFWVTREFAKRAFSGRISMEDICRETSAQLTYIKQAGLDVTHIDTHGHVHKIPTVFWALRKALKNSGITTIRRMQNLFYHQPGQASQCYNNLANIFIRQLGKTTDYFLMVTGTLDEQDDDWWQFSIDNLPEGVTEIGFHPGLDEKQRRMDTLPVLRSGSALLEKNGIELISFNELGQASDVSVECMTK